MRGHGQAREVVIAGASTGHGHLAAAQYLEAAIAAVDDSITTRAVNVFDLLSAPTRRVLEGGWRLLSLHWPALYRAVYAPLLRNGVSARVMGALMKAEQARLGECGEFPGATLYLATHPLAAVWGAIARARNPLTVWVVGTDYVVHSLHCVTNVDRMYAPPGFEYVGEPSQLNATRSKIIEAGIPLSPTFWNPRSRWDARHRLGWRQEDFVVLVSFGGEGLNAERHTVLIEALARLEIKLVVLSGRNSAFRHALESRLSPHVQRGVVSVLGFTHEIADLLTATDCVVGKSGGLTVGEVLAIGKPFCVVERLPGQEDYNASFLKLHGLACQAKNVRDVVAWVEGLRASGADDELTARMVRMGRPFSSRLIATDVVEHVKHKRRRPREAVA